MTNPFIQSHSHSSHSSNTQRLSRRERQIMDILFREGRASAADVQVALSDPPSYSAVRALLRILEEKGHISHVQEGQRYVFLPTQAQHTAARSALQQVVQTFFSGSIEKAVTTLLSEADRPLSDDELTRLTELIEQAKQNSTGESGETKEKSQ